MKATTRREADLGRYELLCLLATGGMASVHLARAKGIGGFEKLLAIKRILPSGERARDDDFVRMFLDEARVAATLEHSNIAHVFDVGLAGYEPFLAMEYLHGQDVRSILRAIRAPVPTDASCAIGIGVSAGLHYAHEKRGPKGQPLGLVHRDVSPSNIVVTYDGGVKLIDFGIAKATTRVTETASGVLKGKPGYMSPEQCLGQPLDRRSDIFCVGIVLYELTTGTRLAPNNGGSFLQIRAIVESEFRPPSEVVPGYPPELERIVTKALAHDSSARYQTALDLQRDLEELARSLRLDVSPTRLAHFMESTFHDEIDAWRTNEQAGVTLAEHLVRRTAGPVAPGGPAMDGPSTEMEQSEGSHRVSALAPTETALPSLPPPPKGEPGPRYTPKEVDAILGRALHRAQADEAASDGVGHGTLVAAAREVGIPKEAVDAAAREVTASKARGWWPRRLWLFALALAICGAVVMIALREASFRAAAPSVRWVAESDGQVPRGVPSAGVDRAPGSEPLWACRVKYASGTKRPGMQLGRVSAATKTCSIAMGGREVDVPHYEVLTQPVTWVDAASGRVPDGAMAAGMEGPDDGSATLFLCRGTYPPGSSAVQVGKVRPAFQGCAVGVGGKAAWLDRYQVAVEDERR